MPTLPPFDVLNTLTLVLLFTPPRSPVPCPSSMRVGSRGGSMNTLGCISRVQVEILNSYYQPLHRLHGEQVRAVAPGEWPKSGNWPSGWFMGYEGDDRGF